jgi:signal transduction histidine kinase
LLRAFITANRAEIIDRCRSRVVERMAPRATPLELELGIPLFLDELAATLRAHLGDVSGVRVSASLHGGALLKQGFTVAQVVQDYGDVSQAITELAIERRVTIRNEDFKALNLCLDEAIAQAVTGYANARDVRTTAEHSPAAADLGMLAHEMRNLLGTAMLAFEALADGSVGIAGSTGKVLQRSLLGLSHLIDRTLADVRLNAGIAAPEEIVIAQLIEEVEVSAMMAAKSRGHRLTVDIHDGDAVVAADREILAAIVANLVQNACKYTHSHSSVTLRTSATAESVRIEVEDECGGLPSDAAETLFKPFVQRSADRSGLGLGLAICLRGVDALGGAIRVVDMPGKGCVFIVELPRVRHS